ncbi:Protein of unknown function [Chryseobacterium profundimaris]|uniref:Excisionase n=2 Tax=Chryseobacterium profundimaris TaxID=1387275 RepID=A0ABY1NRL8_9FLAO|nr:Protein of unknown function [Chryseobacterium profundimaris]
MTGEEIIELFSYIIPTQEPVQLKDYTTGKYVYGLSGLAKLFDVGKTTAQRYKNAGFLDPAIIQTGRKIIVNAELALQLLKEHQNKQ